MTLIALLAAGVLALLLAVCLYQSSRLKTEIAVLASAHQKLTEAQSISEAAQALALAVGDARVYIYDSANMSLESVVTPGNPEARAFSLAGELEGTAAALKQCFRSAKPQKSAASPKQGALCFVPLVAGSETLGVMECEAKEGGTHDLLVTLAPVAALAFKALRSSTAAASSSAKVNKQQASRPSEPIAARRHSSNKALTFLLVDANMDARGELLEQLSSRGHRVVPASADQSADLGRSIRFDAVVWAVRTDGWKWSDYQDRLREVIPAFILVSSGYDTALADSLRASRGFLLSRPIEEAELDSVLGQVAGTLTAKPK